jgi:hypothetical protein
VGSTSIRASYTMFSSFILRRKLKEGKETKIKLCSQEKKVKKRGKGKGSFGGEVQGVLD